MKFGDRIALLREKAGLTQEQLAQKIGISRAALAKYEKSRREPDFETLDKIADFFNVSVDYLLGRNKEREKETIDIKEALENKSKVATWEGKELTEEQRQALKEIFAVIRDKLLEESAGKEGKGIRAETAI
ncbi:helix-turn-helix transcriptional regulator [Polycladomyces sp. WAk]|uniref:Helix-turn-helix transcriptional regulator n=1 Tax=Polycladomyces zharkentensis TaxID=2807616 RepID=A0ABS2WML9_9BACL|nr:helix-turn-helix transcriptional regulator [Polycladomyces sp. WAk]MBN2910803.1 helix-turn-helix transcriptional regulator [Polycladomyces sp. WAk]